MRYESWSDSLFSSEPSLEDVVFASASIQTAFPFRERSRRLRALCLRFSYFLLHSPSVSQIPPRRICQINSIACRQEIWRCHRCGGKRRFPPRHGMAWQGMAEYGRQTECGSPHGSIYPDSKHRREWKVPRRGIHSRARRYDIFFSPLCTLRSWASWKIEKSPRQEARGHGRVRKKTES